MFIDYLVHELFQFISLHEQPKFWKKNSQFREIKNIYEKKTSLFRSH